MPGLRSCVRLLRRTVRLLLLLLCVHASASCTAFSPLIVMAEPRRSSRVPFVTSGPQRHALAWVLMNFGARSVVRRPVHPECTPTVFAGPSSWAPRSQPLAQMIPRTCASLSIKAQQLQELFNADAGQAARVHPLDQRRCCARCVCSLDEQRASAGACLTCKGWQRWVPLVFGLLFSMPKMHARALRSPVADTVIFQHNTDGLAPQEAS